MAEFWASYETNFFRIEPTETTMSGKAECQLALAEEKEASFLECLLLNNMIRCRDKSGNLIKSFIRHNFNSLSLISLSIFAERNMTSAEWLPVSHQTRWEEVD